jgi:hypothetical protein
MNCISGGGKLAPPFAWSVTASLPFIVHGFVRPVPFFQIIAMLAADSGVSALYSSPEKL